MQYGVGFDSPASRSTQGCRHALHPIFARLVHGPEGLRTLLRVRSGRIKGGVRSFMGGLGSGERIGLGDPIRPDRPVLTRGALYSLLLLFFLLHSTRSRLKSRKSWFGYFLRDQCGICYPKIRAPRALQRSALCLLVFARGVHITAGSSAVAWRRLLAAQCVCAFFSVL